MVTVLGSFLFCLCICVGSCVVVVCALYLNSSVTLLHIGDIKLGGGGYVYVHWRIYIRYVDILLAGLVAIEL